MNALAVSSGAAFVLTLLLTPLVRDVSHALGWVDRPDQYRKLHRRAVPRTGGVAILLSYVVALLIGGQFATVARLLPGVAIVFAAGLADDRFDLKPRYKLAAEIAGAVCIYAARVRFEWAGAAPWACFLATVGWLVLCANGFNLIDGVDGLSAGVGCTAAIGICVAALLGGNAALALTTAPLAASLLGFLRYNFSPASVFLGDSGSLSIGFLLGVCTIGSGGRPAATIMVVAVPLLEVGLSIARRFVANQPIFGGDRGHIHHRLLDRGFSPRAVVLVLCGAAALTSAVSVMPNSAAMLLGVGAAAAGVRYLGYAEFDAAARFLREWLRPALGGLVIVDRLERALTAARTVEECWIALEATGRALGYGRVVARLSGVRFASGPGGASEAWQMRVNLSGGDYVNISQSPGARQPPRVLAAFVEVAGAALPKALASIEVETGAFAPSRVPIASGDRDRRVSEIRLDGMPVECVAGMAHPAR